MRIIPACAYSNYSGKNHQIRRALSLLVFIVQTHRPDNASRISRERTLLVFTCLHRLIGSAWERKSDRRFFCCKQIFKILLARFLNRNYFWLLSVVAQWKLAKYYVESEQVYLFQHDILTLQCLQSIYSGVHVLFGLI